MKFKDMAASKVGRGSIWKKARKDSQLSAATENILLEAESLGLGAVWCGVAPGRERMEAVCAALGVDPALEPFAILSIGYPLKPAQQQDRYDPARVHFVR